MNYKNKAYAAKHLGITRARLDRGIREGRYPAIQLDSGRVLVDLDILEPIVRDEHRRVNRVGTGELSRITGLTASTIRQGVKAGWLPYEKDGHYLLFEVEAVHDALMNMCVKQEED